VIEQLCVRVATSTLLEDRRDALRSLRSLARDYAPDVGARATLHALTALRSDREDTELARFALDLLVLVLRPAGASGPPAPSTPSTVAGGPAAAGGHARPATPQAAAAELILKQDGSVPLFVSLLDEYEAVVRTLALQVLTLLTHHFPDTIQRLISAAPAALSRITELLTDQSEPARNEAILLLVQLVRGAPVIQKAVVFQNAFEYSLDVIRDERFADGTVVVDDALTLIAHLLRNNPSNANYFRETSCIPRLAEFFHHLFGSMSSPVAGGATVSVPLAWSEAKVRHTLLALDVVRLLLVGSGSTSGASGGGGGTAASSAAVTASTVTPNQRALLQANMLHYVASIALSEGDRFPVKVRSRAMLTLGDMLRGFPAGQDLFGKMTCGYDSSVLYLTKQLVDTRRTVAERSCVMHCMVGYLAGNADAQLRVVGDMSVGGASAVLPSEGGVLSSALFSNSDAFTNWFAAMVLCVCFEGSAACRERGLQATVSFHLGQKPMLLLESCINVLADPATTRERTRVSLLRLLISWLFECPKAAKVLMDSKLGLVHIISRVEDDHVNDLERGLAACVVGLLLTYGSETIDGETWTVSLLREALSKRLGLDRLLEAVSMLSTVDAYVNAAKLARQTTDVGEVCGQLAESCAGRNADMRECRRRCSMCRLLHCTDVCSS
jgi:hypothetical protein